MSRSILFSPVAQSEFEAAIVWYNDELPSLGDEFEDEVNLVLKRIAKQPEHFPKVSRLVRKALLHRFPYAIFFTETDELVGIVAVYHGARNPAELRKRF